MTTTTVRPRETSLTQREAQILTDIANGFSSKEVADRHNVSKRTVDFHLANIYMKLKVNNRMQAVNEARQSGFIK